MQRRVQHAVKFIESRGRMAHGGQQSDDLMELESRKQQMRDNKRRLAVLPSA